MSLRQQPEFEAMETETTTATTTETKMTTETTIDNVAAASVAATTAIATAATTAVAAPKAQAKFAPAFADKDNALPIARVELWGQSPASIVATQGAAKHSTLGSLGKEVHFKLMSYNLRFMAVPGSNDKEAKEKCRNSYDNVNISNGGGNLHDYIESLKAEGYSKAHVEQYTDLWGEVVWSEKTGTIPEEQREVVRVQLAKTSAGPFAFFCDQRGMKESMGLVPKLEVIGIRAEAREGKSGDFTNFSYFVPKAV